MGTSSQPTYKDPEHSPLAAEFWQGARSGKFMLQVCVDCGQVVYYPSSLCDRCWSSDLRWEQATGLGTVESFTKAYRSFSPEFAGDVPYTVMLVRLDEGPRVLTWLAEESEQLADAELRIHSRGELVFERISDATSLHRFRLLPEA